VVRASWAPRLRRHGDETEQSNGDRESRSFHAMNSESTQVDARGMRALS